MRSSPARLAVALAGVLAAVAVAPVTPAGSAASPVVAAWTQLGPAGAQVARVVISSGDCPALGYRTARGSRSVAMTVRAAPSAAFADTVCEAALPAGTTAAGIPGRALPVRAKTLKKVAVIGDTGCAVYGKKNQDCGSPQAWPFVPIAASIAREHPDVIIHVGDLLYRETVCPAGCSAALDADFFAPGAAMFAAAPLVMTRGNHEAYGADCAGWFRYFAFAPAVTSCTSRERFTPPYRIKLSSARELVVLDSSAAPDKNAATYIPEFTKELKQVSALANQKHVWLVSHVPMWDVAKGKGIEGGPAILEQALQKTGKPLPSRIRLVVSGHLHQLEYLSFTTKVPAQLILGNGGTLLSNALKGSLAGRVVDPTDNVTVAEGRARSLFGYGLISGEGSVKLRRVNGKTYKACSLSGRRLHCR